MLVASGVHKLCSVLRPASKDPPVLLGALILACFGATRLGGREFVQLFSQRLCENAECLLECGACNFCAGGRDVVWDVPSARKNPFTYAHLPQKAALQEELHVSGGHCYTLRAVVEHRGSTIRAGHYVALTRPSSGGPSLLRNDACDTARPHGPTAQVVQAAYLCFYVRTT